MASSSQGFLGIVDLSGGKLRKVGGGGGGGRIMHQQNVIGTAIDFIPNTFSQYRLSSNFLKIALQNIFPSTCLGTSG